MCENILLQSLKYIEINLKYIHLPLSLTCLVHIFCKSENVYFSCYNDVDTDRYACSHKNADVFVDADTDADTDADRSISYIRLWMLHAPSRVNTILTYTHHCLWRVG